MDEKKKNECTGCTACAQICPSSCITMQADIEGFEYPTINASRCIKCGLCERICPVLKLNPVDDSIRSAYAAYAKDTDLRLQSSSGGLFTVLAEEILHRGGIVFGAAFDKSFGVHHIDVDNDSDLAQLRGSKYLQSRMENSFVRARELLNSGKIVLFAGTACQIAGLKAYLRHDSELLYTIDVLCHGVPSPSVWKKYLHEMEHKHGSFAQQIYFRQKAAGWKNYEVKINFKNSSVFTQQFCNNPFMDLFLKNICLRPSCYNCQFKALNRPSDITIGDSWGIDKYMPEMDDNKGTSVVILHSEKGERLFKAIQNKLMYQTGNIDQLLPPTADSRKSVPIHPRREAFFRQFVKGVSINKLSKLTQPTLAEKIKAKIKLVLKTVIH